MIDVIKDGLLDTLKLLPYLLITFMILEFIEHKFSNKSKQLLSNNKKYGSLFGGILGALPQCGFSTMAANMFSCHIITIGTVIAVFLSTSDEMLPIMLSEKVDITILLRIIGFKALIGIIIGFIVDLIFKNRTLKNDNIVDICEKDHCDCDHESILLSSVKHTLKIGLFVLIANLLINIIIYYIGEEQLSGVLLNKNIFTYFLASLIGLIPNCASSVIITELYLSNVITIGTLFSGLLTGSGLGLLLLFKTNKNMKENILVLSIVYFVGVLVGIIIDFIV